jgi:hypothetical protein
VGVEGLAVLGGQALEAMVVIDEARAGKLEEELNDKRRQGGAA